jgi:hypothetical protein
MTEDKPVIELVKDEKAEKAAKKAKIARVDKVRAAILEALEKAKGVIVASNLEGAGFRGVATFEDDGRVWTVMLDCEPKIVTTGELGV